MTPERHPQADEAARYVLDQLPPAARHQFEVQLAQSPELRTLVHELEEGLEVAARAVPQRQPPPQAWAPIEQTIAHEARHKVVMLPGWSSWWRNGWAAAAACLLVFAGYALWSSRNSSKSVPTNISDLATLTPLTEVASANPTTEQPIKPSSIRPATVATTIFPTPQSSGPTKPELINPELTMLRGQVAALQLQLEQLSDLVSQQKAIMAEPGRFKFFPMASNAVASGDSMPMQLSAGLQRAMFYAMARDMGWLPNLGRAAGPGMSTPGTKAFAGVDFVDLRAPVDNAAATTASAQPAETESTATAETPISIGSSGNIPGFMAGTNLVMAFDRSIIGDGGSLAFWTASGLGSHQFVGSAVMSENPMVVTVPVDQVRNGNLVITANPPSGPSNVVGQFFIVRYPPGGHPPP